MKQGPHVSPNRACDFQSIKSFFLNQDTASKIFPQASIQWNPPQMTSHGLRIHMFVRREPPNQLSNSLLLWTGCVFEEYFYICIVLQPDQSGGVLKYVRSLPDRILLQNAAEFAAFELSELYLSTKAQPFIKRDPSWQHPDFEIILSTEREDISFVGVDPSIRVETSQCPQGQRVYCLNITNTKSLALNFKMTRYPSGIAEECFFTVFFGLTGSFSWCGFESNWGTSIKEYKEYRLKRGLDLDLETRIGRERGTWTSDRATTKLPNGAVILAAAKQTPYIPYRFSKAYTLEAKGVTYSLSVKVLTA